MVVLFKDRAFRPANSNEKFDPMHGILPDTDQGLFLRISQGDEASFTALFHAYTPKLHAYLLKLTRDPHQARELVQETFLRVWMKREHLREVSSPSAYLFRIAANLSINYFRAEGNRRKREVSHTAGTNSSDTGEVISVREVAGIIARAVADLPAKRQEIFRMSREQGLSHEEIARQLGLSIQTVKNQIGTALKTIQAAIARDTGLSAAVVTMLLSIQ